MKQVSFSAKGEKPKVTREQALRVARQLGCRGVHQHDDGTWMPCGSHEAFEAIQKGKEEYLRHEAKKKAEIIPTIARRVEKLNTKSNMYFENRSDAAVISKRNGCNSVRTVILGGNKYYAPCSPKIGWEKLREGGVVGIDTLADGSLVSAPIAGKDLDVTEIDAKGFVNFVSRSTDPDVFSDPDSARIRARNLGCIGVRRYTARDGKTVWLPCSNGSDYNRTMGIGGDNKPRRRGSNSRQKSLGKPIGGVSDIDGDGDGFVSGPSGQDNIPAPIAQIDIDQLSPESLEQHRRFLNRNGWDFVEKEWKRIYAIAKRKKKDTPAEASFRGNQGRALLAMTDEQRRAEFERRNRLYNENDWMKNASSAFFKKYQVMYSVLEQLHDREQKLGNNAPKRAKSFATGGIVFHKGVPKPKKQVPIISSDIVNNLAVKVRKHNASVDKAESKTNLRDLKLVFTRGLEDSDEKGAFKRVSDFLSLLSTGKPKDLKYREDNDLLPLDHPWKKSKTAVKSGGFDDGLYGIKISGCCPKSVKRYRKL